GPHLVADLVLRVGRLPRGPGHALAADVHRGESFTELTHPQPDAVADLLHRRELAALQRLGRADDVVLTIARRSRDRRAVGQRADRAVEDRVTRTVGDLRRGRFQVAASPVGAVRQQWFAVRL